MSSIGKGIGNKRVLSLVLNFLMISSLVFTTFSKVYAQDGETPVPTETPTAISVVTEAPTVEPTLAPTAEPTLAPTLAPTAAPTAEPTAAPTAEPTVVPTAPPTEVSATDGLPNFSLAAPDGWDAPVVLSLQPGTHVNDTLTDGEDEYLDLAVLNSGAETTALFTTCLKIDGEQVQCWDANGLAAGAYFPVEDWLYIANRGAGSHHFEVTVDANNTVAESDETDNTWAFDFTWLPSGVAAQSAGSPLIEDALERPDLPGMHEQSATGSSLPGLYDTSVYMIGSIAVGVILPESAGSAENWTSIEQTQVSIEIPEGLARWADWSDISNADTNKDAVNANVSFEYDFRYSIPTTVEPIQLSSVDQCTWISQVMTNMGFTNSGGCFYQVYDYLAYLRSSKGTQWATAVFVVDSSADTDGTFTNGYFGYAYFNGPFIVMTYDNDGWSIGNMDLVVQHEMGHIFGAGDNYYQAGYGGCMSTTDRYGYLGIANSNCAYNNLSADTNVLMNNNNPNRIHWTSQYQIGWRDSDGDHIADVVDTLPKFSMGTLQPNLTVTGAVYDEPYLTTTYWNDVTLNRITSARFRVDSGAWQAISASDGAFNSDHEDVSFNLGEHSNGTHTLDVEGTNSRGNIRITTTNFTLLLPCYKLSATANPTTGGTVNTTPAPNCLGTKYSDGTEITLTAVSKTNFGFSKWSDAAIDNPYVFNIHENKVLQANFVFLAAPVLTSPVTTLVTQDTTPDFAWNTVAYGNTYEIQVDNLATFAAPIEQTSIVAGLTYTAAPLTDGRKYWRVRAINVNVEPGAWSLARTITIDTTPPMAPALKLPANLASVRGTPTFSWLAAATANAYQFEYDDNINFSSPVYTSGTLATRTHLPPTISLGTYYWHVRARDPIGNWSNWSTARTITILPPIPTAPVLSSPVTTLVTQDTTPDFAWNTVAYGNTYEIQVDNLATFAAPIEQTSIVAGLTYTAAPLTDGRKYWRVRAINVNVEPGAWSLARTITIDTTPPMAPALKLPANLASVRGTPTFSWLAAATANAYQFEYDDNINFSSPVYTSGTLATRTNKPPATVR
ncbi:MAG: hypothetical protein IMZ62_11185 [Chloroflexi bacterium]|nr:hypothetical protein [Chloroflexota bacterium]